jgi:hypothetical protein
MKLNSIVMFTFAASEMSYGTYRMSLSECFGDERGRVHGSI